jgi:cystine transport system substrate-binding protein
MSLATWRRTLMLSSLGLALSTALLAPAMAGEQLQKIKDSGTLSVGVEGTYPPFSFQDENGKLSGFEVDFSEALGKQLGVKVKFQPTKWDGMLAALESRRLDVVINQVTISEERRQKYDFSQPYTLSGIQALTRKSNAGQFNTAQDLAGKKVGMGLGTNYEQWLREHVPQAIIKTYDDDPTKYQDLRIGRIDAILVDRLAAFELIEKTGDSLVLAGPPVSLQAAGVTLRKGEPELLAAINQAIDALRADGTLANLSNKYFAADVTQ